MCGTEIEFIFWFLKLLIKRKFRFGYEEDTSHYPFDGGISHSDDLIYLFPHPPNVADLNEADTKMAMNMVDLWASFAEYGTPQLKSNTKFHWPPKTSISHFTSSSFLQKIQKKIHNSSKISEILRKIICCVIQIFGDHTYI